MNNIHELTGTIMNTTTTINTQEVLRLKKLIEQFRLFDNEIQAQTILTILNVYLNQDHPDGYSVTDMSKELGISQAAASRNIMLWSKLTRKKEVGPDFVAAKECPVNRSRKRLSLTVRGIKYLGNIFPI